MLTPLPLRIAIALFWRALQIFAIIPASVLGTIALVIALFGGSPVATAVDSVYAWADDSVRGTQPGFVLKTTCETPQVGPGALQQATRAPDLAAPTPASECVKVTHELVAVADDKQAVIALATKAYRWLVIAGATLLLLQLGPRRFLGLRFAPRFLADPLLSVALGLGFPLPPDPQVQLEPAQ